MMLMFYNLQNSGLTPEQIYNDKTERTIRMVHEDIIDIIKR